MVAVRMSGLSRGDWLGRSNTYRAVCLSNDAAAEKDSLSHHSRGISARRTHPNRFANDGVLASEILHEFVLSEILGGHRSVCSDNSYIIYRASCWISIWIWLAIDELSEWVEFGTGIRAVHAANIAELHDVEAPNLSIHARQVACLRCDGSPDRSWVSW